MKKAATKSANIGFGVLKNTPLNIQQNTLATNNLQFNTLYQNNDGRFNIPNIRINNNILSKMNSTQLNLLQKNVPLKSKTGELINSNYIVRPYVF